MKHLIVDKHLDLSLFTHLFPFAHLRVIEKGKETYFPTGRGLCHWKMEKCIAINILRHVKPANRTITAHG